VERAKNRSNGIEVYNDGRFFSGGGGNFSFPANGNTGTGEREKRLLVLPTTVHGGAGGFSNFDR